MGIDEGNLLQLTVTGLLVMGVERYMLKKCVKFLFFTE